MKYTEYLNDDKKFRRFTGLSGKQFAELLPFFEEVHIEYFCRYDLNGKRRDSWRNFNIYKCSPLPTAEDRLFFILVYLKTNPLQKKYAVRFNMQPNQCSRLIKALHHVLETCLREEESMPNDIPKVIKTLLENYSKNKRKNKYTDELIIED